MYTSFFKLKAKPFQISSDPDFMWLGEKHKEALATLKYGVLDNKGFLLLTGDVGTGKTTLINALIQSLSDDVIFTSVTDPSLSKLDFFNYIAASFNIDHEFRSKGAFLARFRNYLLEAYENKKKVLLIIDEAQLLTQELLEEIRLLSNIEKTSTKLINIFFVGQNEFNEFLNQEQNRAVRQRLTLNYNIDPLTPDETEEYIKFRLKVAGADHPIFEASAVQEVFMYSGGFPRRINIICDHALLSGYVKEIQTIDATTVQECAKELKIPAYVRNRDINGFADYAAKPLPNPQTRSVILKPKTPEAEKKNGGHIITWAIASVLFLVLCWWILFPGSFQGIVTTTANQLNFFKKSPLPDPEPQTPYQIQTDSAKKGSPSVTPGKSSENTTGPTDEPESIKHVIQQPQNLTASVQDGVDESIPGTEKLSDPIVTDKVEPLVEKKNGLSSIPAMLVDELQNKTEPIRGPDEIKKKIPLPEDPIVIRFNYNTNNFTQEGFNALQNFADVLVMHPDSKILITGYTDSDGYQQYNIKLSEFRANIVKSFLLGRGASSNQIEIKGLGSLNPIESNKTAWGRTMNRRVVIEVLQ